MMQEITHLLKLMASLSKHIKCRIEYFGLVKNDHIVKLFLVNTNS